MISKIVGGLFILTGLFIVLGFPSIIHFQPERMGRAGVVIGIALIALGLFLMKI